MKIVVNRSRGWNRVAVDVPIARRPGRGSRARGVPSRRRRDERRAGLEGANARRSFEVWGFEALGPRICRSGWWCARVPGPTCTRRRASCAPATAARAAPKRASVQRSARDHPDEAAGTPWSDALPREEIERVTLRIYDTLTAREARVRAGQRPGRAGMYVCGMTVQDQAARRAHPRLALGRSHAALPRCTSVTRSRTSTTSPTSTTRSSSARTARACEYGAVSERNIEAYLRYRRSPQHPARHDLPARHAPHRRDPGADRSADRARATPMPPAATSTSRCARSPTTASCQAGTSTTCARARASRSARPSAIRSTSRCGRAPSPASPRGRARGAGAPRLAHRVLGDEHEVPGRDLRHPRRRAGPDLPAPRERDRPVARPRPAGRSPTSGPRTAW